MTDFNTVNWRWHIKMLPFGLMCVSIGDFTFIEAVEKCEDYVNEQHLDPNMAIVCQGCTEYPLKTAKRILKLKKLYE
jgi:hypothetical protein